MDKIDAVTEEQWLACNEYNRNITDEFLMNSTQLSPDTIDTYRSNSKIWFNYVREHLNNKPQIEIKSRDYMFFQNYLINLDHSYSDIKNKRSAVSSLNNYIVLFYSDVYPMFRNFIVRGMPAPEKSFVREKNPPTKEEYLHLVDELEKREEWQKLAYVKFTYQTGCRRGESRQLLKEIVNYEPVVKQKTVKNEDGTEETKDIVYYLCHKIRCKGRGKQGKVRRFKISKDTMDALKKWLEVRGDDDNPYMFVAKNSVECRQISESALNVWCSGMFAKIVGRRIHPHIFREAIATVSVVEEGKDISTAQKLLGHKSSETTQIYVIRDDSDDADDLFLDD
jgi:integrase